MNTLEAIQKLYDDIKSMFLSEIDTQVLLIEPIIQLAGWDIRDPKVVKRASRNPLRHEFDIETYLNPQKPETVRLAIECKSLGSVEFNISKIASRAGVGKLTQKQRADLSLYWTNKSQDGVGQLRAYCVNYSQFSQEESIAVLTNGFEWIVFNNDIFLSESTLGTI